MGGGTRDSIGSTPHGEPEAREPEKVTTPVNPREWWTERAFGRRSVPGRHGSPMESSRHGRGVPLGGDPQCLSKGRAERVPFNGRFLHNSPAAKARDTLRQYGEAHLPEEWRAALHGTRASLIVWALSSWGHGLRGCRGTLAGSAPTVAVVGVAHHLPPGYLSSFDHVPIPGNISLD